MKKIAISFAGFLAPALLLASGLAQAPGDVFVRTYGQPSDALVEKYRWKRVEALNQAAFEITPLLSGADQVEQNHYSLLVHRTTKVAHLARQGGIKGDWQFFGPISLSGT